MPHVRSVAVGIWLTRGSRHEPEEHAGIAHFVEHMLFKGTPTRSAEAIAQQVDSIGGQIDAFTSKEYAGYYLKVLDEHLPLAVDILADLICNPLFAEEDIEREKKVILEEIKMVEDTPDDLVHELFAEGFWSNHPLGRPILGTPASVSALDRATLKAYFTDTYVASNFVVVAVGNLEHGNVQDLLERALADSPHNGSPAAQSPPKVATVVQVRKKELEQSHIVFGTEALPQHHPERYAGYALNTTLGGSMSSRLFQNVREKRGLAYSVFSGLSAYQDAGALSIYAGCANEAVAELIDVVVAEIRQMKAGGLDPDRAAPRQGSPEGLVDARPGKHVEPHVAPRAPGDVSRSDLRPRRDARRHRARDGRGRVAPGGSVFHRRLIGRDGARQRQWITGDEGTTRRCDSALHAP